MEFIIFLIFIISFVIRLKNEKNKKAEKENKSAQNNKPLFENYEKDSNSQTPTANKTIFEHIPTILNNKNSLETVFENLFGDEDEDEEDEDILENKTTINTNNRNFQGVNRPNAQGQQKNNKPLKNNFSFEGMSYEGASSKKGFVSTEGTSSKEGFCIEPNANHCAVKHEPDSVYTTEITDETFSAFSKEDLLKGIVLGEILNSPKFKAN